ncbi:hypothetical protein CORT_0F02980 [Candida orthopsilosis Co 90-125]|uniref:N-acetyltransferase domain-containing protein n=1 Tax=Candida orthopsilosis (strain 90-125) TaxID=1136231 RepID=H8X8P7_CANO9|nr:hypothetical protein CORT_0F02980 [Candida orthopsilosis Co 90-125]CCG24522.1 hypothetical protein CORT_0F02980 [Candida orthopsilosis Co 90-125]
MSTTTIKSNIMPLRSQTVSSDVRQLTYDDVPKAASALLDAFKEDPLSNYLVYHVKDAAKRRQCELALFEAYLRQHMTKGLVFGQGETASSFETVSIWSTPTSAEQGLESFSHLMESGYDKVWDLFGVDGRDKIFQGLMPLLHDSFDRITGTDKRFRGKDVYTLVYVGSTAAARGKGNLRKLFDYMFSNYIDCDGGALTYLESSSPVNIPIYERFGFHLVEQIVLGNKSGVEGKDCAVMHVMIRGMKGNDWTKDNCRL